MARHEHLPKELKHLAWLSRDDADGQEYWAAMNLMDHYAAANHALIHKHIANKLGAHVILDIENHHNFPWKETHVVNGEEREVIVHRKGATPAGAGVLGIINAANAVHGETETAQDLRYLLDQGSPLGGARPKSAVALPDGRLARCGRRRRGPVRSRDPDTAFGRGRVFAPHAQSAFGPSGLGRSPASRRKAWLCDAARRAAEATSGRWRKRPPVRATRARIQTTRRHSAPQNEGVRQTVSPLPTRGESRCS